MSLVSPRAALVAGALAPDFSLASTAGTPCRLVDALAQSPVLLAFFPLAFTRVCTTELCAFTEDFEQFASSGVTILPISVDAVPSLSAFKAQYGLHVELLSDFKREVSRAYGVLLEDTFYSQRAYFLIGTDGVIRWAHVEDVARNRRENSELLAVIREYAPRAP